MNPECINYTEEEFHDVLKDLIFQLEEENVSLQEVRRQHYISLLNVVGIRVCTEVHENQLCYVAYYNKDFVKNRLRILRSWYNNIIC